jgi:adenosylhomocysteine nucleosidase
VTDLSFDDPCLLFALRRESAPFLQEFRPQESFPGAPCLARFCGPSWLTVLVLETGVGTRRTGAALDWLTRRPVLKNVPYHPRLVLAAGFCGALRENHRVGDVILATEVLDTHGRRWPTTWPGELTGEWRPPLHRGRVLTVPQLVGSPADKARLAAEYDAVALDMESALVAQRCSQHGIPFGCVRAVSDEVGTPLSPRLVHLLSGGHVSWLRLAAALVREPRLLGDMRQLARATRLAARQLGAALGELLPLTLPGGADL